MSDTRLAEELGRMTLFRGLSPTALARLAEGARRVAPADGAPLFAQGDPEPAEAEAHPALEQLAGIDPDSLTPREALDALYALKGMLK